MPPPLQLAGGTTALKLVSILKLDMKTVKSTGGGWDNQPDNN